MSSVIYCGASPVRLNAHSNFLLPLPPPRSSLSPYSPPPSLPPWLRLSVQNFRAAIFPPGRVTRGPNATVNDTIRRDRLVDADAPTLWLEPLPEAPTLEKVEP